MNIVRKAAKAKECSQCGAKKRKMFSMGKIIDQTPNRELIYTMKASWMCKVCFVRRHLEAVNSHVEWDYEEPE